MDKSILTKKQKRFLSLFSKNKSLKDRFYLTGGTALCAYYIPYRFSEDLDFFSEDDVDTSTITVFLKSIKKELKYKSFDLNTSFNRNIIQIIFENETLKTEFTYFPFPQVEKPDVKNGLKVDSVTDIAVNKLFTIYQKPRSRDYTDLYMIIQKNHYEINDLLKKARAKFDWHIDPLKLGAQFLKVKSLKDYPKLIDKLEEEVWQGFFIQEANNLRGKILTRS